MTDIAPITEVVLTSDLFDDCLDVESLSPAAEAVLDAYMKGFGWLDSPTKKDGRCIAATLRAAADQTQMKAPFGNTDADAGVFAAHQAIHAGFFAIAAELEGQ